ncbi:hypothetical protein [Marinomonas sp.]|jgi:energy-converting hydrogenase Eha subunit A|uniref:hypothetical protein n=1 Tax=Marinomonas sp. TaxID=1904862 RepID=UPI003A93217D
MESTTENCINWIAIVISIISASIAGLSYWQAKKSAKEAARANKLNAKPYILEIRSSYRRLKGLLQIYAEQIAKEEVIKEYRFFHEMSEDHIKGELQALLTQYYDEIFFELCTRPATLESMDKVPSIQVLETRINELFEEMLIETRLEVN